MKNTLSCVSIGERCIIKDLLLDGNIRRRLQDIGAIKGTEIECVLKSPSGDPSAYEIRGAVIAIRNCDADKILVKNI